MKRELDYEAIRNEFRFKQNFKVPPEPLISVINHPDLLDVQLSS